MPKPSGYALTRFQFRLSTDQRARLENLADESGLTESEIVRLALDGMLDDLTEFPDDILQERSRLITTLGLDENDTFILS